MAITTEVMDLKIMVIEVTTTVVTAATGATIMEVGTVDTVDIMGIVVAVIAMEEDINQIMTAIIIMIITIMDTSLIMDTTHTDQIITVEVVEDIQEEMITTIPHIMVTDMDIHPLIM